MASARKIIRCNAEVTLSGLRVRYTDGREPEVFEWRRLAEASSSGTASRWRVTDVDEPGSREARAIRLCVQGERASELCRRVYVRSMVLSVKKQGETIRQEYDFPWGFIIMDVLGSTFPLYWGVLLILMAFRILTTDVPWMQNVSGSMIVLIGLGGVMCFTATVLFWHSLFVNVIGFSARFAAAEFSGSGLTCQRRNGDRVFHSWEELLPQRSSNSNQLVFRDGFSVRLPICFNGKALTGLAHKLAGHSCREPRHNTILRMALGGIVVLVFFLLIGHAIEHTGNSPYVPNSGYKKARMFVMIPVFLALVSGVPPIIERWRKKKRRNRKLSERGHE